ncbi:hypothetical protein L6164_033941 [Bauhinia variegata]|uniref:Uncharacterized protein n=1 Tax=Bauhinia variegata TaxID=167791 RepID=A0ACB9KTH5_BAUVA|nr:hypothetical protein L6164_033941 [Bauhinia variegata]
MDDSTIPTLNSGSAKPPPSSSLRRRNSIATSVVMPTGNKESQATLEDFELVSLKSSLFSYTSLKDMLPSNSAAINSPRSSSVMVSSGYEISIRNRLVKQAAWAYLQPMSSSPDSSTGPDFLRRLLQRLSFSASNNNNPLSACFAFITHHLIPAITRIFDRMLGAIMGQETTK